MGFFHDIHHRYGLQTVRSLKLWAHTNTKLASMINRRIFLLKCRQHGVIPPFISNDPGINPTTLSTWDPKAREHIDRNLTKLKKQILNVEIQSTIKHINYLEISLTEIENNLTNSLPLYIFTTFKRKQSITFKRNFYRIKDRNIKKLAKLTTNALLNLNIQKKWFRNLSNSAIPREVATFLSLGPKFCINPTLKQVGVHRILSDVEAIIHDFDENKKNVCRAKITNVLTNFCNNKKNNNPNYYINHIYTLTKRFLKNNRDLLVLQSDKGNVTCVMSRDDYRNKSLEILLDNKSYELLKRDPTSTFQQKANTTVSYLKKKKALHPNVAKTLMIYNAVAPKFYGLPKIHKPELCLRPIIASMDAPNNNIAKYIAKVLTLGYNEDNSYHIKDSFQFAEFINNFQLPKDYTLISLDVVSLFSNITLNMVIKVVTDKWNNIKKHTSLGLEEFTSLLVFVFDTSYCSFDGKFYKQLQGSPMGSVLSPVLAQYIMDHILDLVIPTLNYNLPFIKKFVDDIICAIPHNECENIIKVFNEFDDHIKFTIEIESNNRIPFLDTLLIKTNDNVIILDWYQKPMSSSRFIHFHSDQPINVKINLVLCLKNRILKISHPTLHMTNLIRLRELLLTNSYPRKLLSTLLFNVQKNKTGSTNISTSAGISPKLKYASLPYISNLTPELKNILRSDNLKIANRLALPAKSLYSKLKDPTPTPYQSNVVYKINCADCSQCYIGHTSRNLSGRITSHISDCKLKPQACALSSHCNNLKHNIDFKSATVLDSERNLIKRSFLEMFYIYKYENTMNKKTDVDGLSTIYIDLLDKTCVAQNSVDNS